MKAFSFRTAFLLSLCTAEALASTGDPTVASPWAELRKAPVFTSETIGLSKLWGPALPVGTSFRVEKVYGRWIYGRATPPLSIPRSHQAPPGWVFSRLLLMPGDSDTLPPAVARWTRGLIYHSRAAYGKLPAPVEDFARFDLLESLTLSKKTLAAFSLPESPGGASMFPALLPEAHASDTGKDPAPMGMVGADLSFLEQEFKVIQEQKRKESYASESKKLRPPPAPSINDGIRRAILGRYMIERYFDLPPVSLEEIDGFIYMRVTALRALAGCPKEIQSYWKNKHWNFFRVFHLKSRPEARHPWLEAALPAGYFVVSGRAIAAAQNEAELAYLLVRQLVREPRLKRKLAAIGAKGWPRSLSTKAEEAWDAVLKAQSTKENEKFDVSDEIAADMQAAHCLANSGYQPTAALSYLRNMGANREQPWANWFTKNTIGLDYRIQRVKALTEDDLAKRRYPNATGTHPKRFAAATKQWNVLP